MSGGSNITNTEARLGALRVQQSSQGVPIALLWGRNRVSPNLLWLADFAAVEHLTSQKAGKGGGTTMTNVTYTYTASVLMGLCAGVCSGVRSVYRNKDKLVATTKVMPPQLVNESFALPVNSVITVSGSARWVSTDSVSDGTNPITDYTVSAGVYTFGASVAVGSLVLIGYNIASATQDLTALQVAGLTQFGTGAIGQAVWGYLASAHPENAVPYSGIAYVAAPNFLLGAAAGLPQLSFEVDGPLQVSATNVDVNPADIVYDLLSNPIYGAGFNSAQIADFAAYRSWCNAAGLWFSPLWTERKGVFEHINQLAMLTNSRPLWSVSVLKLIPMAAKVISGAAGTYTPAPEYSVAVYAFNDNDFMDPVREMRSAPADKYNRVSIKYKNRATEYADAVESAEDRASIDAYGLREAPEIASASEVTTAAVAAVVAELALREFTSEGVEYHFTVPICYDLLEPLDLVQIEDVRIDLTPRIVRVVSIAEADDSGALQLVCEDVRVTGAVAQLRQGGSGFTYGGGPPSPVSVRAVMMPTAATGNVQQLWVGVDAGPNWGGSDIWVSSSGAGYRKVATINARTRMGLIASSLPTTSVEINPTQSVDVNVFGTGVFDNISPVDFAAYRSLVWLKGELLCYRDAALAGASKYTLSYLRRGLYGTAAPAHIPGDPWMRLDDTVTIIPVAAAELGSTVYVKVTSRNALGTYIQGLEEVAATPVVLSSNISTPSPVQSLALTTPFVGTTFDINWGAAPRASDYRVEVLSTAGVVKRVAYTSAQTFSYLREDATTDGGALRNYILRVRGRNVSGLGLGVDLPVNNPAPDAIVGVNTTGTGTNRTIAWAASPATDLAGYLVRYSIVAGFNPSAGAGTAGYDGTATTTILTGLTTGTMYYVRVAAYDVWDKATAALNWSTETAFTV